MSFKNRAIFGVLWAGVQKFGTMILSFVSNIILARLLSPDDFGCIGMLAIFIAISQTFIDGGFGSALIQKDNPTQRDYSTIFFWNVSLAVILYVIIYFAAPMIANFYGIEILENLLRFQSIVLIVNSLGIIQRVRLRKQLLFKQQAVIDVLSSIIGVTVAIVLAYNGFGVWSLVVYQLILSVCQTIGLCLVHRWLPSFEFNFTSFRQLFRYGGFLLISDILNVICDNIQGIIIGKKFSPAIMGYYSQARKLEEVPTTGISYVVSQVTFPYFSSVKNEMSTLRIAHEKSLLVSNYLNISLMVLLIIVAEPLILFLFSDKWLESVPYFRVLCVAGLANCMQSVNYQLYVSVGRSKSMFKWNLLKRAIGIILILIGALHGVEGILWGMVVGFWFSYIVNAMLAGRVTGYKLGMQLVDLFPILFVSGMSGLIISFLPHLFTLSSVVIIILQILLYVVILFLTSMIFRLKAFEICRRVLIDLRK